MKKILRVFPRRTNATPLDDDVRINAAPGFFDEADEVHISVTFTWDIPYAEFLYHQWKRIAPVQMGGPAFNQPGGDFVPGRYLKKGYVITSRGCPNRCWFCSVHTREGGQVRELPITDGWIVQDDNLLACSPQHVDKVFDMLKHQPHRAQFTGGLEAKLITPEIAIRLYNLNPESIFLAYDTPDDLEPLIHAGNLLTLAGFRQDILRAYVLCGYEGDSFKKAIKRFGQAWAAGFRPFAMLYRDDSGKYQKDWKAFQREWANPTILACNLQKYFGPKNITIGRHEYKRL